MSWCSQQAWLVALDMCPKATQPAHHFSLFLTVWIWSTWHQSPQVEVFDTGASGWAQTWLLGKITEMMTPFIYCWWMALAKLEHWSVTLRAGFLLSTGGVQNWDSNGLLEKDWASRAARGTAAPIALLWLLSPDAKQKGICSVSQALTARHIHSIDSLQTR